MTSTPGSEGDRREPDAQPTQQIPRGPYGQPAGDPGPGQPPGGHYGQPGATYGQPPGGQYGQPSGGQYGQPAGTGQGFGGQYGQPSGGQYGQPSGGQYGQPSGGEQAYGAQPYGGQPGGQPYGTPYGGQPGFGGPPQAPGRSKKKPLIIVAVLVVLAAIVVGAILLFARAGDVNLEDALGDAIREAGGREVTNVQCPDDVEAEQGNRYTCTASVDGQETTYEIVFDRDDHFNATPRPR